MIIYPCPLRKNGFGHMSQEVTDQHNPFSALSDTQDKLSRVSESVDTCFLTRLQTTVRQCTGLMSKRRVKTKSGF